MCGGDNANIDLDGAAASEGLNFSILQNMEQLGLQTHIHIADFVEQDGAVLGSLNLPACQWWRR